MHARAPAPIHMHPHGLVPICTCIYTHMRMHPQVAVVAAEEDVVRKASLAKMAQEVYAPYVHPYAPYVHQYAPTGMHLQACAIRHALSSCRKYRTHAPIGMHSQICIYPHPRVSHVHASRCMAIFCMCMLVCSCLHVHAFLTMCIPLSPGPYEDC